MPENLFIPNYISIPGCEIVQRMRWFRIKLSATIFIQASPLSTGKDLSLLTFKANPSPFSSLSP